MLERMYAGDELTAIIERARQLDAAAFDALVERYSARLFGFLYRFTNQPEDAEDLVQEVFVRLVRTIRDYQHDGRFEPWLFRIAANLARDRVRRIGRSPTLASLDGPTPESDEESDGDAAGQAGGAAPDASLVDRESAVQLDRALARLSDPEREVILMRHYGEMSFADIAEVTSAPLGTVLARAHRALAKLRKWMEGGS
ncbi:MAG: sigma-70 family RNA polymerase sigma factor [Planctomycetes bacterium]|nr:sigma-70 family RNA polymerase sigma factor [Planctomycetota bacterium]